MSEKPSNPDNSEERPRYIILEQGDINRPTVANGDWNKWAEWVKDGIRLNRKKADELDSKVDELVVAMKVQQIKVGIYGCVGASIPTIAAFILLLLTGRL